MNYRKISIALLDLDGRTDYNWFTLLRIGSDGFLPSNFVVKVEHLSAPDASHLDSGYPTADSLANYTGKGTRI